MMQGSPQSPGSLVEDARFDLGVWSMLAPEYAAWAHEASALAGDLERALRNGEVYAVLQPRMALRAGGGVVLAGAEALARWNHPILGPVTPDRFIPVAEATGLIEPLGEFMLEAAARVLRDWLDRFGRAPPVAVNLSARQFADAGLPQRLERVRSLHGLPVGLLELEVTESAAMRDAPRSAAVLRDLAAVGVPVAIDDFGTGYSSLAYLRRFAVSAIKIDKSLVDDIGVDPDANAVCDAILRLGQALDIRVVAEGVEHVRQLEFLRQRRCDEVQGWLFGRPVRPEVFEAERLVVPFPRYPRETRNRTHAPSLR